MCYNKGQNSRKNIKMWPNKIIHPQRWKHFPSGSISNKHGCKLQSQIRLTRHKQTPQPSVSLRGFKSVKGKEQRTDQERDTEELKCREGSVHQVDAQVAAWGRAGDNREKKKVNNIGSYGSRC